MLDQEKLLELSASWRQEKFRIGGTTYIVKKLLPLDAWETMEIIREGIGPAIMDTNVSEEGRIKLTDMLLAFVNLDRSVVAQVRDRLFEEVRFTNKTAKTPLIVAENMEIAFQGLDFMAVYEVLIRAVVINFGESLSVRMRREGAATPPSSQ